MRIAVNDECVATLENCGAFAGFTDYPDWDDSRKFSALIADNVCDDSRSLVRGQGGTSVCDAFLIGENHEQINSRCSTCSLYVSSNLGSNPYINVQPKSNDRLKLL